jgi:TolB-like protein
LKDTLRTAESVASVCFDRFTLDLRRGCVREGDREIGLRPKSFAVLCHLVANAGRLITKDEFARTIWRNVVVSDESLARCISDIRQALGDQGRNIVRTVPRRGYIVAAGIEARPHARPDGKAVATPSERADGPAGPAEQTVWGDTTQRRNTASIAVLPFATIGPGGDRRWFAEGMVEEIVTQLALGSSWLAIAPQPRFAGDVWGIDTRQPAARPGARYLVEGAVRHSHGRIRISARLIEAATGSYLWADRYDRGPDRALDVQDEVARTVVQAIRPVIAKAEMQRAFRIPSARLQPSEALHRGLWHLSRNNPADNGRAREYFNAALLLDGRFAPAHSSLALTYLREMAVFGTQTVEDGRIKAEASARKAVEIDLEQCDAQAVLAFAEQYGGQMEKAWDRVSMALASNRHSPMANRVKGAILLANGRAAAGRQALWDAFGLDPYAHNVIYILGEIAFSHLLDRDFGELQRVAEYIAIRCPSHPHGQRYLTVALGHLGRTREARNALENWCQTFPDDFARTTRDRPRFMNPELHDVILDGLRRAGGHA